MPVDNNHDTLWPCNESVRFLILWKPDVWVGVPSEACFQNELIVQIKEGFLTDVAYKNH